MNREEILTELIGSKDITFATALASTQKQASNEIKDAEKMQENIQNLMQRLKIARNAGIELIHSMAYVARDYSIAAFDNNDKLKLVVAFGFRLGKMVGPQDDPLEALEVAWRHATDRINELEAHKRWLEEDTNLRLTEDQQKRLNEAMQAIGCKWEESPKIISDWLELFNQNYHTWDDVITATKSLNWAVNKASFILGYMAHVFLQEEIDKED